MTSAGPSRINGRKRTRPSFLLEDNTPSDPALFSSDPPDPSAEHYFSPRPKKQYRGTWWQNEKQGRRVRRGFQRNMDSGVFMGSDSSYESSNGEDQREPRSDDTVPDTDFIPDNAAPNMPSREPHRPVRISEPPAISLAKKRIASFAEDGSFTESGIDDDIDSWLKTHYQNDAGYHNLGLLCLNDHGLPYLTEDMLLPLRQLVKPPMWALRLERHDKYDADSSDESSWDDGDDLEALDRKFSFNLSDNALTSVPATLFAIPGLNALQLCNNNLSNLPPSIGNAKSLHSIHLSGNRIRWLPGELLDMFHVAPYGRTGLSFHHNPLLQPFSYVGFYDRFRSVIGSTHRQSPIGLYRIHNTIPSTLTELRDHLDRLQQSSPDNSCREGASDVFEVQKNWLVRLYEHLLAVPELLWLDWVVKRDETQLSAEEQEMIVARWGCPVETVRDRDLVAGQEASPLLIAALNMEYQLRTAFKRETFLIAATPICYLDISGKPTNATIPLPSAVPLDEAILPARLVKALPRVNFENEPDRQLESLTALPQRSSVSDKQLPVHSLFSLCLRSASSAADAGQLPELLPDDVAPSVRAGLAVAEAAQKEGGRYCSSCKRQYIVPRAEWLEYHYIHDLESPLGGQIDLLFVPFLRRVCSWGCVPHIEFDD